MNQQILMNFSKAPTDDDISVIANEQLQNLPDELMELFEDLAIQIEEMPDEATESDLELDDPFELLALYKAGTELAPGVEKKVANDDDVARQAALNCMEFLEKFPPTTQDIEKAMEIQKQYIISETALSIYVNECLHFDYEIYRKGAGFVDYLYSARDQEVRSMSGGSSRRYLVMLESVWQEC